VIPGAEGVVAGPMIALHTAIVALRHRTTVAMPNGAVASSPRGEGRRSRALPRDAPRKSLQKAKV
jgi:hypothetical protein